ncbi:hypothetical protein GH714_026372 [Hevea brasiliensis]|uniref:Kinesin motor domain-containing protein n=1 Tax=Hevea brasiliensis TaxID=3981 RepID=A0A6A6LBE0_HEVBR|nr:hypothetical protein GH714_026372 [Hevea brasiliensis]
MAKRTLELEKSKMDGKSTREEDVIKLIKEKEQTNIELSTLKHELEIAKRTLELEKSKMDEKRKAEEEDMIKSVKEKEQTNNELSALKQELEITKKTYELRCLQMETEAKDAKADLDKRLKELVQLLDDSRNKVKVLEAYSKSQKQKWNKKEIIFQRLTEFQFGALQELRLSSQCIKHEILKAKKSYSEDFNCLGLKFKKLVVEGENYHLVLAENRKLFNELQDLKGNIRVYCRIRPLISGQAEKQTTIEYIGENGELVVANPSKQGKDGNRLFRFNKVYGPNSTQGEVFSDTQPLIRCVLDGYNVCIFAYGQTGSGKTYTMTGPNGATEEEWGVNYRALNDLFSISQNRSSSFMYEVGSISEHNGLVVPDATMHPVRSTSDVIELMEIGLNNRAVSATTLNERSSRSHSVVSIHVHGKDLHTGATSQGNLHLVDLAGSERVDRSEVTGDRLREAQHINKSLSALGDVIFALAQKRGQAKTLMFVQLNPDVASLKDTISEKDGEIERLQLLKDLKNAYPSVNGEKQGTPLKHGYSSMSNDSVRGALRNQKQSSKTTSDHDYCSENIDKHSELDSQQSAEDLKQQSRFLKQSKYSRGDINQDVEILGYADGDREDRLSDVSDGCLSVGTEPDISTGESTKPLESEGNKVLSRVRSLQKLRQTTSSSSRDSPRAPTSMRKTATTNTISVKPPRRWQ